MKASKKRRQIEQLEKQMSEVRERRDRLAKAGKTMMPSTMYPEGGELFQKLTGELERLKKERDALLRH